MPLWDWACAAYARPAVADLCLQLQDEDRQNVPLLLWAAWAGPMDAAVLSRAADLARTWDAAALQPLRAARQGLKAPLSPIPGAARERLREEVKVAELSAERLLLEALEALTPSPCAGDRLQALTGAAAAWGIAAAHHRLAALCGALE